MLVRVWSYVFDVYVLVYYVDCCVNSHLSESLLYWSMFSVRFTMEFFYYDKSYVQNVNCLITGYCGPVAAMSVLIKRP